MIAAPPELDAPHTASIAREAMGDLLIFILFVGGYLALQLFILPRLGVST